MFQHAISVEVEADRLPRRWQGYAPPPGLTAGSQAGVGAAHSEATAIPGDAKPKCEEGAVKDELPEKDNPNTTAAKDNPVMVDRPHAGNPVEKAAAARRECGAPGRNIFVSKPPNGGMTAEVTPDKVPPAWLAFVVIRLQFVNQCVC
jgi:hypothetical protein